MYEPTDIIDEDDEAIDEIELDLLVNDEVKHLEIPIPYDYEGSAILQLVMQDVEPLEEHDKTGDDTVGQMDAESFSNWEARARDLQEIDCMWGELDDAGLTAGYWPGALDLRTDEPSTLYLDETIDNDLHNIAVMRNETKAAFRVMRESCGASQADLAQALGVNVRAVKRWEAPGQPEPPHDAWNLVEGWHADVKIGAQWHVDRAEELRYDAHEAYTLVIYRNQEEFDEVLSPMLAQAPSYHWQDAIAEAQAEAEAQGHESWYEIDREYTNFPGTRSYWRANAAAKLAATLMDLKNIPHGFAYPSEQLPSLYWEGVWVPRADVQRIELSDRTIVVCGMR